MKPLKARAKTTTVGTPSPKDWTSCLPYALITVLYLILALSLRVARGGGPDWDSFMAATDLILKGQWLQLYENHQSFFSFSFPPLPFFLMAPFRFLSQALGLPPGAGDAFTAVPMLAGDLLSAWMLVKLVRRFREVSEREGLFLFAFYLTAWMVFFDSAYHSHFDSILLFFLFAAIERLQVGKATVAGVFLGLALLTKQTALIVMIPMAFVLFWGKGRRESGRAFGTAALVALAAMAPFLSADFSGVKSVLLEAPNQRPIGYQTIWWVFAGNDNAMAWLNTAEPYLNALILLLVIGYSGLMVWRYGIGFNQPRLLGLCAACAVIMVFLEGWGSLHYFLLPFGFLLAWEAASGGWPWLSVLFTAVLSDQFILKYSSETHYGFNQWTAWTMILLFTGTLAYATRQLRLKKIN